jgi:imidazolonepropionase
VIQADFIIEGAAELVTLAGQSIRPRRGDEMRELGIIPQGALAARRGTIVWVGPSASLAADVKPLPFC